MPDRPTPPGPIWVLKSRTHAGFFPGFLVSWFGLLGWTWRWDVRVQYWDGMGYMAWAVHVGFVASWQCSRVTFLFILFLWYVFVWRFLGYRLRIHTSSGLIGCIRNDIDGRTVKGQALGARNLGRQLRPLSPYKGFFFYEAILLACLLDHQHL